LPLGQDNIEQLITFGQQFQRSNEVDAILLANWIGVSDPFASSPTAPLRYAPAVGHAVGAWIRSLNTNGIHYVPALKNNPLIGVNAVSGFNAPRDVDRTRVADAGINVLQILPGFGCVVRNWFTPSTAPEWKFGNSMIMRNYVKVSAVESLQASENQPNTLARVGADAIMLGAFMHRLWNSGSTGTVPLGETFGTESEGEAYEVIGDATNNSRASLLAGERNLFIYLAIPSPAGSIRIGVGLLYNVS
jgi:phage tail sheath protein FI